MRLLMTPALVTLAPDGSLASVAWVRPGPRRSPAPSRPHDGHVGWREGGRPRRVVEVIDAWRYDGRWWEGKGLHRDYFLVELEGGVKAELFLEEGDWWVARVSD